MKNYIVVGLLSVMLILSSLIGVDLLKKNEELHILLDKQSDIINDNKTEISNYKKAIDELNQRIRDQDSVIKEKNNRITEVKKTLVEKEKEIEKLKKQSPLANVSRGESTKRKSYIYEVTAYTANQESTGKTPSHPAYGITASGTKVQEGRTVACPPSLEFGTKIHIESVGYRICEDRGGGIGNGKLDLYIENLQEAIKFGRKRLSVMILK